MYAQNPDLVSGVLGAVRGANADDGHPPALGRPRRLEQPRRGIGQLMHSPRHRYREDLHLVWMLCARQVWPRQIQTPARGGRVAEGDETVRHPAAAQQQAARAARAQDLAATMK